MMESSSKSILHSTFSGNIDRNITLEKTRMPTSTTIPKSDHEYSSATPDLQKVQSTTTNPNLTQASSAIQLRKKNARSMSKQKRRKQRKGVEKAETSRAKLDKKKRDSCVKNRNIKNRKVWADHVGHFES